MRSSVLLGSLPYLAFGLCAFGILVQYLFVRRRLGALHRDLSEAWVVLGGSRLWKMSCFCLLLGHLAGLLFPAQVLLWNRVPVRLYFLESAAFAIGVIALFCCLGLVWRHLGRSSKSIIREVGDIALLGLLLVALFSGLLTAAFYRWGSSWGPATLTPYSLALLRGNPMVRWAVQMPFLVQLHV